MYKNNNMKDQSGFTLIELVVVVVLIGIILSIVTLNFLRLNERYRVESNVKEIYSILMKARNDSSRTNIPQTAILNAGQLQIGPDVNGDGTIDGGPVTTESLNFTLNCSNFTPPPPTPCGGVTVTFDRRGLANSNQTMSITGFSSGTTPAMDCIAISATRINIGIMNGANCDER